ncbi:hypothetical protein D3C83_148200 [compost metagenome]
METTIPTIEVTDDAHTCRLRRPNRERHAVDSAHLPYVSAELVVDLFMLSFAKEIQVEFANGWRK